MLAGFLACVISGAGAPARAQSQTPAPGQAQPEGSRPAARPGSGVKPAGESVRKTKKAAPARAKAKAQDPRREPSEARKEEIRKTVEQRRQRRARRAQGRGVDDLRPVGAIVPWPMPPALIIRQTPQVHDEVGSLFDVLRRAR